jgi:hypothetical protein
MKKIILAMLCVSAVVFTSCKKDDAGPETAEKILGAWKLQKAVDEYYQPVNTLVDIEETLGTAGDSVVFRKDNMVYSYSDVEGDDVAPYEIVNETTIKIEDELYDIKKLTSTQLYLHQDHKEAATNSRYVQRLYFVR